MIELVIKAVVLPMGLGAALLIGARRLGGRHRADARVVPGGAAWGLALAAALALSVFVQDGAPPWPPAARWHAVVYAVGAASLIGGVSERFSFSNLVIGVAAALTGFVVVFLVRLPGIDRLGWRILLGAGVGAMGVVLSVAARRENGLIWPILGAVLLTTLSGLFMQSHFAKAAVACGAAAAACGSGGVLQLFRQAGRFSVAGALTVATAAPVLSLTGYAYDQSGPMRWTWGLAFLAPLGGIFLARKRSAQARLKDKMLTLLCVVVLCGGALGLDAAARQAKKQASTTPEYSPY